jgi:hypothetical protein
MRTALYTVKCTLTVFNVIGSLIVAVIRETGPLRFQSLRL